MRVVLVAPSFGEFGGVEAFVFRLGQFVAGAEDGEATICFKRVASFAMKPSLEASIEHSPVCVTFVNRASRGLVAQIRAADVIHSQNPSIDVALAAFLLRKPHVMTIHAWRRQRFTPRALLARVAAALADRRLYNSDFVWRSWEPRRRRSTSAKLPVVSRLPSGVVPPDRRKGFVFVGRWVPNKGIDVLLEAYARAALDREAWPLVLMGDGPLRPAIESDVRSRGVEGVVITGYVDDDVRNETIRHSKWMVVPPHTNEELGLTPIEARSVGVPCIVTRDGGLLEAAGPHSLHCEPRSPEQLSRLLERAATMDEDAYRRLSEDTRRHLEAHLRPLSLYFDLYRELLGDRRRAPGRRRGPR